MVMRFDYCYHTHTYRCGHANGKDKEYVINAIANGYKVLGFSDHVMLKGYKQPGIRGDYSQLNGYIKSINKLKKAFEDQIEIHIGFECEYLPSQMNYYKKLLKEKKVEYLILGQHCYINQYKEFQWYLGMDNKHQRIEKYTHDLIEGMATGIFAYVAHPDYFVRLFQEYDPIIEKCARMICEASLKYDVPLEMNLGGVRGWFLKENNLHYPSPHFWRIAGEMGVKTVIGVDAHDPKDFSISNYRYVFELIDKYQINFLKDYRINEKK